MRIVLGLAVVGVLAQNVLVVRSNKNLRVALDAYSYKELRSGDSVLGVGGVDLEGHRISIPFNSDARPVVVIGMSVNCPYCRKSLEHWRHIVDAARTMDFRSVIVLRDAMPDILAFVNEGNALPGDIVADPTFQTYMSLRLEVVPSTSVLGPGGKVTRAWIGEVDDKRAQEVLDVLADESTRFRTTERNGGLR